jgi:Fe2+ or Zn2+ uptake regulation protein
MRRREIAPDAAADLLSARGLRATRQRVAVLRTLVADEGHPTALALHERLATHQKGLSPKTVYEILDALVEAGIARRVTEVPGPPRYEVEPGPHYHAHCRRCGELFDIPARADTAIRRRVSLPRGFTLEGIHVSLEGRCARCTRAR